jgi:hypothetical protein
MVRTALVLISMSFLSGCLCSLVPIPSLDKRRVASIRTVDDRLTAFGADDFPTNVMREHNWIPDWYYLTLEFRKR